MSSPWQTAVGIGIAIAVLWWMHTRAHNHPHTAIQTHVWRPSNPGFVYPERDARFGIADYLEERDNFGIALAGGGTKGMSFAHGAMRALREAGILQRARYVAVSSGSAFFGIPFYYQSLDSVDDFLGKSLEPQHLTPENLTGADMGTMITRMKFPVLKYWPPNFPHSRTHKPEDDHAPAESESVSAEGHPPFPPWEPPAVIKNIWDCLRDPCFCAATLVIPETSVENLWEYFVGNVFMKPFDLAQRDAVYAQPEDVARVQAKLGNNTKVFPTRDIKKDRLPFLISQEAIYAPRTGTDPDWNPIAAFPYEHTPLYSGMVQGYSGDDAASYNGLGDVLVEPFATRSEIIEPFIDSAVGDVQIGQDRMWSNMGGLAAWSAITTGWSSAFQMAAGWENNLMKGDSFCPEAVAEKLMSHIPLWSPLAVDPFTKVPITKTAPIGDAGIYDDLGHLPLLRRGVSKMVIFDTSASPSKNSSGWADPGKMSYLTAAFGQPNMELGAPAGAPYATEKRDYLTVFEPSEFKHLWDEITRLWKAREPVIVRGTYTTVANPHFGIAGGRKVEVVWVSGMDVQEWRHALPSDTEKMLPRRFPNYKVFDVISQFQMGAVSQFGSWLGKKAVPDLQAMLGPTPQSAQSVYV